MGYPALSHHNSFLFILKTMNFGTMNLNFRTLHSCMLAKFMAKQGDGDNARTLACDRVTEVAGRILIMSNKSPSIHRTSGVSITLSASPPAEEGEKRHHLQCNPIAHLQFLQDMAHSRVSVSRGEQHPQASPRGSSSCQHHTAAPWSGGEAHSLHGKKDPHAPNHNPLSLHVDWKGTLAFWKQSCRERSPSSSTAFMPESKHPYITCFRVPCPPSQPYIQLLLWRCCFLLIVTLPAFPVLLEDLPTSPLQLALKFTDYCSLFQGMLGVFGVNEGYQDTLKRHTLKLKVQSLERNMRKTTLNAESNALLPHIRSQLKAKTTIH